MAGAWPASNIATMTGTPEYGRERRARPRARFDLLRDLLHRSLRSAQGRGRSAYAGLGVYLVGGMVAAALGIFAFAIIASWVDLGATQQVDERVLGWMGAHQTPWAGTVMLEITLLGTGLVVAVIVGVAATFLWLCAHRPAALLLLVATGGGILLNSLLKLAFDRPRPHLFASGAHAFSSSFPSGHAMSATIVYGTVAYLASRLQRTAGARVVTLIVAAVLVLLICFSRVYLGVHYPSDVIAGVAVGVGWAAFCMAALEGIARSAHGDAGGGSTRLAALLVIAASASCLSPVPSLAAQPTSPPTLIVYAASDLAEAFGQLVPAFEAESGARVRVVVGSSGNLAMQIEHGAPADVFFAANAGFVDRLQAKHLIAADTRRPYTRGRIVLVTAAGIPASSLHDLARAPVTRVAIANPAYAPYGQAAREALLASGEWTLVRAKIVYAENVRHAFQLVESGAVDAGIVASSSVAGCVTTPPASVRVVPIDDSLYVPLDQVVAVMARSHRQNLARRFISFIIGPNARVTMTRCGFADPR
ncbi:MAG: hypothetical protein NVS1B4_16790 [Gemmatimonadaceae bacterium]